MTQTTEKWDPLIWLKLTFEWYEGAMVFRVLIFNFLFRASSKNERLDQNDFDNYYGIFFGSALLKVTWSQLRLNFILNNYEKNWQPHLKNTLQLKILGT